MLFFSICKIFLFQKGLQCKNRIKIGRQSGFITLFRFRQFLTENGYLLWCIYGKPDTVSGAFNHSNTDIFTNQKTFIFLRRSISIVRFLSVLVVCRTGFCQKRTEFMPISVRRIFQDHLNSLTRFRIYHDWTFQIDRIIQII